MNKRHIFIWSLYDFANSLVFITFLLYFSKWLVVNQGLSDWWYNATFIIGSIGLIFFAPWLGGKADRLKKGRYYLVLSTIGSCLFYALALIAAISHWNIFFPAVLFGLGNFFYQLAFVFYNPLLESLSDSKNQGKVSGIGLFGNYLGQIAGVLIALPFVSGKISLGVDILIAPMIPAIILFFLLSLPLLCNKKIFVAHQRTLDGKPDANRKLARFFKSIFLLPGLSFFMISYFLFSDAITTLVNNFSIFMSHLFTVNDDQISILVLIVIMSAGIGALVYGWISDRIGSQKSLLYSLMAWVVIIPAISFSTSYSVFFAFSAIIGFFIGATFAVSRKVLIELVPREDLNYFFGIYAISERAATIAGPVLWTMALAIGGYRWAMCSMVIFQIVSVVLMNKVIKIRKNYSQPRII